MKTTLIVTVHNRPSMLHDILLSLASQSHPVDRVIVADDGSTEDVVSVMRAAAVQCKVPITHVRQPHQGFRVARSRNNAIREAEDGMLIFADQDLLFTKNYIETFVRHLVPGRFLVGYPLRLDAEQTQALTEAMIVSCDFSTITTAEQRQLIVKQNRKDRFYALLHRLHLRKIGPKLRSGVFGINKSDLLKVNGFDENYEGWGSEDDDLGWRLDAAGVTGKNVFKTEYVLHQYHEPFHVPGVKVNKAYFEKRKRSIASGQFRCQNGLQLDVARHHDVTVETYLP